MVQDQPIDREQSGGPIADRDWSRVETDLGCAILVVFAVIVLVLMVVVLVAAP